MNVPARQRHADDDGEARAIAALEARLDTLAAEFEQFKQAAKLCGTSRYHTTAHSAAPRPRRRCSVSSLRTRAAWRSAAPSCSGTRPSSTARPRGGALGRWY